MLDGQLVGNDGGALAHPVINDLQQIGPRGRVQVANAPVIEHQHIDLGELL
jgi:hypothetical protein